MRMRSVFLSCLLFLSAYVCLAGVGLSADTYVIDANAPAGGKVYNSLEALRRDIANGLVFFGPNDIIELRNDDASLTQPITLATGTQITVRSADGKHYTVGSAVPSSTTWSDMFVVQGNSPSSTFENIHVSDTGRFSNTITSNNLGGSAGTLVVSNSLLESKGGTAIFMNGAHVAEINNTIIKGYTSSIESYSPASTININFDQNANFYTDWDGTLIAAGTVNTNVAKDKYFRLNDGIIGMNFNKTGEGILKIGNSAVNRLNIQEGTLHFQGQHSGDTVTVGANAVFKLTIDPGNLEEIWNSGDSTKPFYAFSSRLTLTGGLVAQNGARMELGGVSKMPVVQNGYSATYAIIQADVDDSSVPSSMNIDNKLMSAYLKSGDVQKFRADALAGKIEAMDSYYPEDIADHTGYFLVVDHVANLDTLEGVGHYADVYRRGTLSEMERDLLDSIYAQGGTSGHHRGYLQTIGGQIVQNTMLAMRHNQANLVGKVNRRLTAYQKEELEHNPNDVEDSNAVDYYSDWEPCTTYGQMWASLDQSWMSQNDMESIAGYRFSTTTLTIGYDYHMDEWIYGGVLAYSSGDMKLKSESATRSDIKNLLAALYASWAQDGWYVSGTGVAGYGWNDSRSVYRLPGMNLSSRTGNYSTSTLALNTELGYMMETELYGVPVRATPYGSLTYSRYHRQAVNDMGAYNGTVDLRKKYKAGSWNTWEWALGTRISAPFERENYTLVPSLDVAWTRTNGDYHAHGGEVHMVSNPSGAWTVPLLSKNRSSLRAIAGVDMHLRNNITVGANYEFEWRKEYWKNQLNVNMAMEF